jgi:hypothetical protein
VDVTTNVMHENVSLLLENDQSLEDIQSKTDDLTQAVPRPRVHCCVVVFTGGSAA